MSSSSLVRELHIHVDSPLAYWTTYDLLTSWTTLHILQSGKGNTTVGLAVHRPSTARATQDCVCFMSHEPFLLLFVNFISALKIDGVSPRPLKFESCETMIQSSPCDLSLLMSLDKHDNIGLHFEGGRRKEWLSTSHLTYSQAPNNKGCSLAAKPQPPLGGGAKKS